MIVESFTKQYPTIWKDSREMLHLKASLWPASVKQFMRGELTMAHISWTAPFPWPNTCGVGLRGIAHKSPLNVLSESPKAVLTKFTLFWMVVNVQWIGSLGTFSKKLGIQWCA